MQSDIKRGRAITFKKNKVFELCRIKAHAMITVGKTKVTGEEK